MYMPMHFKLGEFACNCGCGRMEMNDQFLLMLDAARGAVDVPFIINSGRRCKAWNVQAGGSPTSSHLKGCAADIKTIGGRDRELILGALIRAGFRRLGIGRGFIHVDNDPGKSPAVWLY